MRPAPSTLRVLSWIVLAAGIAGAVFLWVTAPDTVETTRRIVGHANLSFQDLEVRVSWAKVAVGGASLLLGVFLWALGRAVAGLAEAIHAPGPGPAQAIR